MAESAINRSEAVARLKQRFLGPDRGKPERDNCLRFLRTALTEAGFEITGDFKTDALQWRKIAGRAEPLDVAAFRWVTGDYHVALMIDHRWAIQSSDRTNGIANIEITREPWAERVVSEAEGQPLNAPQTEIAKRVGIKNPENVRIVLCEKLPAPDDSEIREAYFRADFFSLAVALTIGHVIWVKRSENKPPVAGLINAGSTSRYDLDRIWLNRQADNQISRLVLSHELRHVQQYEAVGSIALCTAKMLHELSRAGYVDSRYERDARNYELAD